MVFCAECKIKNVFIDNFGQPAEFCSNQCRKTAVEQRHVKPCIKCQTWPMVRLPDGSRSPYCGKQCQNSGAGSPVSLRPPYRPIPQSNYPIPQSNYPIPQSNYPMPHSNHPMPQSNHPCLPIGVSPHQAQPGNARPMGGPWVMTTIPLCRYCHSKPCWKDNATQLYSSYCTRTCKEAAARAPRVVSNMNSVLSTSQQNYNGQMTSPVTDSQISLVSQTNRLPSLQCGTMQQYSLHHHQPHLQQNPPPLPSERPQMNDSLYSQANNNPQQRDNLQQPQSTLNSNSTGHHFRFPNTDIPVSHPNSQYSDNQTPPPIPTNKPTRIHYPNTTINNTSQLMQPPSLSQQSTEIPKGQAQEQNQPHSPVQVQQRPHSQVQDQQRPHSQVQDQQRPHSQVQDQQRPHSQVQDQQRPHSQVLDQQRPLPQAQDQQQPQSQAQVQQRPQSQVQDQQQQVQQVQESQVQVQQRSQSQEEVQEQQSQVQPKSAFNSEDDTDEPPPYTPNDEFTRDLAPGEDISIRKVTRDDNFDEQNPYGFRTVINDNSDGQDQNNNQLNNNQEQRTQRSRWRR